MNRFGGPEAASAIFRNSPDHGRRFNTKMALTLFLCTIALIACNLPSNASAVTETPTLTPTMSPTPSETSTPSPTPRMSTPTLDWITTPDNNVATREARWDATRAVEPHGSTEWVEKLATFPDWYKDAVIGMTGSTTTRNSDGLTKYWYMCNGAVVFKTKVRGADGGKYIVLSNVTNDHCSFDQFDASNSSPLRLSLRGVSGSKESYSTFATSTVLTNTAGTSPIDMALVSVLASENPVNQQIVPMGVERFLPGSLIDNSNTKNIRGVGIPWANSHSFSFFEGFLGYIATNSKSKVEYFPVYDVNAVPGFSGVVPIYDDGDVSGVPGVINALEAYATNLSYMVPNPENIQAQLNVAYDAQMEYLLGLGYQIIP